MNNKWMRIGAVAMGVTLVGLMVFTSAAFAQEPLAGGGPGGGGGGRMRMGGGGRDTALVTVAAQVLGMNQTDLVATLNTGKTIADVAKDKGVALDKIVDAVIAARKPALDQAVTSGRLTQAQADIRLANMRTTITAQLSAQFEPRGYGDGTGVCTGTGMGPAQNRGQRGNTQP